MRPRRIHPSIRRATGAISVAALLAAATVGVAVATSHAPNNSPPRQDYDEQEAAGVPEDKLAMARELVERYDAAYGKPGLELDAAAGPSADPWSGVVTGIHEQFDRQLLLGRLEASNVFETVIDGELIQVFAGRRVGEATAGVLYAVRWSPPGVFASGNEYPVPLAKAGKVRFTGVSSPTVVEGVTEDGRNFRFDVKRRSFDQ